MPDCRSLRAGLLMLACVFALLAPTAGAHLHLCFDGKESPISAHVTAGGDHGEHHRDDTHTDVDLAWTSDALAKPHTSVLASLPVLLAALWLSLPAHGASRPRAGRARRRAYAAWPYLLPPLRGPPLIGA